MSFPVTLFHYEDKGTGNVWWNNGTFPYSRLCVNGTFIELSYKYAFCA